MSRVWPGANLCLLNKQVALRRARGGNLRNWVGIARRVPCLWSTVYSLSGVCQEHSGPGKEKRACRSGRDGIYL